METLDPYWWWYPGLNQLPPNPSRASTSGAIKVQMVATTLDELLSKPCPDKVMFSENDTMHPTGTDVLLTKHLSEPTSDFKKQQANNNRYHQPKTLVKRKRKLAQASRVRNRG